jgi:hypothetical protein
MAGFDHLDPGAMRQREGTAISFTPDLLPVPLQKTDKAAPGNLKELVN